LDLNYYYKQKSITQKRFKNEYKLSERYSALKIERENKEIGELSIEQNLQDKLEDAIFKA